VVHGAIGPDAEDIDSSRRPGDRGGDASKDTPQADPPGPCIAVPVLPVQSTVSPDAEEGEVIYAP
jgi:hypothetical protein